MEWKPLQWLVVYPKTIKRIHIYFNCFQLFNIMIYTSTNNEFFVLKYRIAKFRYYYSINTFCSL